MASAVAIGAITSSLEDRRVQSYNKSAHEIGAADNPDDAVITDDRHTLYAVCRQGLRDLCEAGLLADRDHRCRHHVACTLSTRIFPGVVTVR
jgi:hypothetical protein